MSAPRAAAVLLAAALLLPAAAEALPARGTPVGVTLDEFRIAIHRAKVPAGVVRLNVSNVGEDGHDLAVRRRGRVLARLSELRSGDRGTLRVRLRRARRYRLVCTLADHEARGMRSTLRVRR